MLSASPVVRSRPARILFLTSAAGIAGILLWAQYYVGSYGSIHLARIFYLLFITLDCQAAASLLLILIAAALWPHRTDGRALLRWIGLHPGAIAFGAGVVLCAGTLLVYQNHPLAMDEYAQLFQSQVFAAGHLTGHFPPALIDWLVPHYFQNMFLSVSRDSGAVASGYWPSFALLLTPFTLVGASWACNATIAALTLVVVHRLALRMFGDVEAAGLAVLLTLASPVFFANGISYYSMPAHLLANAVFALLLLDPTDRRALLAGFIGSIALTLHNPVPHILFALPWLMVIARRPDGLRLLGHMAIGYLPLCLLLGFGWFWFTGELRHVQVPVATGTAAASGGLSGMWKTLAVFAIPTWGVLLARLIGLAKIWLWAVPVLPVLAAAGAWKWRHHTPSRLFVASALLTLCGYLLLPVDQGHGWGYRYFHSAWMALPLLAAGVFVRTSTPARQPGLFENEDARSFGVTCALLTLVFGVGFRAVQIHGFIADDLHQLPAYTGTERRVVILDPSATFYGWDLVQNDPWLRGNVVRMITNGTAADAKMMRTHFPELHKVYFDEFGSVWSDAPIQSPRAR